MTCMGCNTPYCDEDELTVKINCYAHSYPQSSLKSAKSRPILGVKRKQAYTMKLLDFVRSYDGIIPLLSPAFGL